jgi:hypothetical protein
MNNKSVQLGNGLYLNQINLSADTSPRKNVGVNHFFICDVSYSMYGELSELRKKLKNRISSLVKDGDTITIIWFSGRNQSGVLKEGVHVNNPVQLQELHDAIDRFLIPVGLTAFNPPLKLANNCRNNMQVANPDMLNSLVFLTDGYNNDSPLQEVLNTIEETSTLFDAVCFVEFGWYADSALLQDLAKKTASKKSGNSKTKIVKEHSPF